ncbi:DUF1493 family protein [Leptospira fletcheri]|uniref:DUF1493 family protein n=1 Tax=Leptospira fletcheri TaxID=2484981 RepID=A0A4R9GC61_9LEPT|nr:DUF1493 family protein [Leptospira fletcheri]TGK08985.1 DUF1493 family protein [Leptospira fletcheri]
MNYNEEERERFLKVAKRVYLCIARNRGERIERLNLEMSLNNKLGLDGDDFDDLLNDIDRYIKIDWSSFDFSHYFNNEGSSSLRLFKILICFPFLIVFIFIKLVLKLFGSSKNVEQFIEPIVGNTKRDFKISDLVLAGFWGKWTEFKLLSIPIEDELKSWQNDFRIRFERKFNTRK